MQLRSALLAATVLAMPFAASAQPVTGLYVGAGVGVNVTQQENVKACQPRPAGNWPGRSRPINGNLNGSTGFGGLVVRRLGLRQRAAGRSRGQLPQQPHRRLHKRQLRRASELAAAAPKQKFGGMVNVLYDFNGLSPWVVPYIGAGVGYVGIKENWHYNNSASLRRRILTRRKRSFRASAALRRARAADGRIVRLSGDPGRGLPTAVGYAGSGGRPLEYRFFGTPATATTTATRRSQLDRRGRSRLRPRSGSARATTTPSWLACATTSASPRRRRRAPAAVPGPGSGALLPGVLRLGQGNAHRPGAPDHQRRRPTTRPRCSTRGSR